MAVETNGDVERASKMIGKAYCDNVIVSGMVRQDLDPPSEMLAVNRLTEFASDGRVILLMREQEGASNREAREKLARLRGTIAISRTTIESVTSSMCRIGWVGLLQT